MKLTQSQWLGIVGMLLAIVGPGLTSVGVPWALCSAVATFGSWLAFRSTGVAPASDAPPVKPPDQKGNASIAFLVVAAVAGAVAMGIGGCGATQIKANDSVDVDVWPGPPCKVSVRADGEVVSTVTSKNLTKKCNFTVVAP